MQAGAKGDACVEYRRSHQLSPQPGPPILRLWREVTLVEEAIVAGDQRVVSDHLNALPSETAELIQIAERIEERRGPGIPSAGGVGGLGEPHRLAGFELIAEGPVEPERRVRAREPVLR